MTFWQFLTNVWNWLEAHTTRMIAVALGTVTTLVGTGVIPEHQLKYWAAGISILTYWRAQSVSQTVSTAKTIVLNQAKYDAQFVPTNAPLPTEVIK
jgi:hypothetical protein